MPNLISPNTTIRLNSKILPVIVLVLSILVIVDGYRGWIILLIPLAGTWLVATIWVFALAKGLEIKREIRLGWAQVGDSLEERFTLKNAARLPALWVEVVGQTNMPDYWANQVRGVNKKSEIRWQIQAVCTRRGVYKLGPTSICAHDPFGFYTVSILNPQSTSLVVTPPVIPLPFIQVAQGGLVGEGNLRKKALEQDINSSGVREYIPGDEVRSIHWPTSARKNALYVHEYERSTSGDWWIMLDLDQDVQLGKGQNATHEHAIIFGASLMDLGMRKGYPVGLAAHGSELVWHTPQLSDGHKWEMMRSLALIEPGHVSLTELLELVRLSAYPKASLIVITPAVHGKWLSSLLSLRRLGVVPTVLLFDIGSFGGSTESFGLVNQLTALGIKNQLISRNLLERRDLYFREPIEWGRQANSEGRIASSTRRNEFSWRDL